MGTITASYATGAVKGDGDNDNVGGLVGGNGGTIAASYATGTVDGGDGDRDIVGGLVGSNSSFDVTASYGFGTRMGGETAGVDRTGDASPDTGAGAVTSAAALTEANSSTGTNDWPARVWDFGNDTQRPVLKWITGFDVLGTSEESTYPCDMTLLPKLPTPQMCLGVIPGQTPR